jgi:hypothetical protein
VVRDENSDVCFTITANHGWFKPIIPPKTVKEKAFDKFLDDNYNSTKEEFTKSQSDRDFIDGLELAFNYAWAAQQLTVRE